MDTNKKNKAREKIILKEYAVENIHAYEYPGSLEGVSMTSIKSFIKNTNIKIISSSDEELIFDLIGVDAPLANALRRIIISEVPTMAIEKVDLYQNTSIIPDEVLAHRLGLIPIKADPREFGYREEDEEINDSKCIKFALKVRCIKKKVSAPGTIEYENDEVFSSQLKWEPIGEQKKKYQGKPIKPVYDDILIAKLRPGQEIDVELICQKGNGKEHAKWSPVSTAFYRLVPDIEFESPILGDDAEELKRICPVNVYDVEDFGKGKKKRAYVKNLRNCTSCRECIRPDKFKEKILLGKKKDHYEFHIESVGVLKAKDIVMEAIKLLREKCEYWLQALDELE